MNNSENIRAALEEFNCAITELMQVVESVTIYNKIDEYHRGSFEYIIRCLNSASNHTSKIQDDA
jgi:hypothetical protein